jgi:hypothetical protein
MDIWDILLPFGTFSVHLVHFSVFGILYQEKSGNPGVKTNFAAVSVGEECDTIKEGWFAARQMNTVDNNKRLSELFPLVRVSAGVARFFLLQHTKTGKNIPNGHKMYRTDTKYTKWC